MIAQSPESDMPEPYRSYVRQRSDVIASVLEDVETKSVQLCSRAITPDERIFANGQGVVYGAVVGQLEDGYKNVLYQTAFRKNSYLGVAAADVFDATQYATNLLNRGERVRIKDSTESDGNGQTVVAHVEDLDKALAPFHGARAGAAVIMPHLEEIYDRVSVGRINLSASGYIYIGRENTVVVDGEEVYGGTELGLFLDGKPNHRDLVEKRLQIPRLLSQLGLNAIKAYDKIASEVGRVSFDVIQGITASGTAVTDVIDITPRVSGATPAEVLAIRAIQLSILAGRPGVGFARSRLLYNPKTIPHTGTNFVKSNALVINAEVTEVAP